MKTPDTLHDIAEQHPEWQPWLAVVHEVLAEVAAGREEWADAVPGAAPAPAHRVPLLNGARVALDCAAAARFFARIASAAAAAPSFRGRQIELPQADVGALFGAAIEADEASLTHLATKAGADAERYRALAALLPLPFLYACHRAWSAFVPAQWSEGYCPVCGAWPAFAEICGIERTRSLRCGRCGCGWRLPVLECAYCGNTDHDELAALVQEQSEASSTVEVCKRCLGYMKAFTRLSATVPERVFLDDLASVELDIAAAARGYRRAPGVGYAARVTVAAGGP